MAAPCHRILPRRSRRTARAYLKKGDLHAQEIPGGLAGALITTFAFPDFTFCQEEAGEGEGGARAPAPARECAQLRAALPFSDQALMAADR
jgi:hypothetical protein